MDSVRPDRELALAGYRVLDLTDEKGMLCGKMLADQGADVIKVEPPGGDRSRAVGPFYHDSAQPEQSLYWWAYNANKRGITLDMTYEQGKDIFRKLVETADLVVESFPRGHLDRLGLGYPALREINPGVVLVSITPFGQTGPYRDYKGGDLVCTALGGLLHLTGDPDRPPVRISFPQAFLHASAQAAASALIALYHRELTGEGQWVDVSAQQSVVPTTLNAMPFWQLNGVLLRRAGPLRKGMSGGLQQRQSWPCKDGFVAFAMIGGGHGMKTNRALVAWMREEGFADDFLNSFQWETLDMASISQETCDQIEEHVGRFFKAHTKHELYQGAVKRRIMLYPASSPKDIFEDPQLTARGFWEPVEHQELEATVTYPGSCVRASTIECGLRRRAPLIGEHNAEVYTELGLAGEDLSILRKTGVV